MLDITLESQLVSLLAINDDGSEVYSVLNVDKSRMICALMSHPDRTIDISAREEQVYKLQQSSAFSMNFPLNASTRTSSKPHIDASQQCIWCDKFGHYYSTCQEFYEAIHQGDIYLSKINRILSK